MSWQDVEHWLWPLFTERWGGWRYHRLGLPAVPYLGCPPAPLPPPPPLLYGAARVCWLALEKRQASSCLRVASAWQLIACAHAHATQHASLSICVCRCERGCGAAPRLLACLGAHVRLLVEQPLHTC